MTVRIYIGIVTGCIALALLVYRLIGDGSGVVGSIGLVLYLASMIAMVTVTLYRIFFLQLRRYSTWILGAVTVVSSLGVFLAIPTIVYALTPLTMVVMLTLHICLWFLLFRSSYTLREAPHEIERERIPDWHAGEILSNHYIWVVLYLLIWAGGMISLIGAATTDVLLSPWQALPQSYLWLTMIGELFVLLFLFSRAKTSIIILVIVLQSVLMHMYIPASSPLPAGGDIWRHIGTVEHMLDGNAIGPSLFGSEARYTKIGPVVLPEVFTAPQQYAYSMQWGIMKLWTAVTGADLIGFSRWFMPLLWAFGIPIIFFYIGYLLFRSSRPALFFAALTLMPFSYQALGSLFLPVTLGYLVFFLALLWLLFAMRYGTQVQWMFVLISIGALSVTYPLHALLYAVLAVVGFYLYRHRLKVESTSRRRFVWLMVLFGFLLLPTIELAVGYSTVPSSIDPVARVVQFVGEHSGWYVASEIRPHDMLSGNILFNHIPAIAHVDNWFTSFRWHLIAVALLVYGLALYGWMYVLTKERRTSWQLLSVLAAMVWGAYIIGWYILDGDRQLIRRLDVLFATMLGCFAWYAALQLIDHYTHAITARPKVTAILFLGSVLIWWGSVSAFSLGPDMRTVSLDEFTVGTYIADTNPDCVLADTWPLLVVEAYTAGRVAGGGFPMDAQFGQAERVALYTTAVDRPTNTLYAQIGDTMSVETCTLALPLTDRDVLSEYTDAYGQPTLVSGFGVWELGLQNSPSSTSIE